jgi:hypothetical protein
MSDLETENRMVPKLKTTDLQNNDLGILFWDATHKCLETCPIYGDCPYAGISMKCDLCYRFLNEVKNATVASLEKNRAKEYQKHLLGTGVFALWTQWLQLEIIRISLENPVYTTPKGEPKIHPVYKAQREVFSSLKNMYESVFGKEAAPNILDEMTSVDSLAEALREE